MKLKATIDNIALAALLFAVVAISAVSTVAIVSAERLISINEKVLQTQRIIASLEAIRFHSTSLDAAERVYLITGGDQDMADRRRASVEIGAELKYLASKRNEDALLSERFARLDAMAQPFLTLGTRNTGSQPPGRLAAAVETARAYADQALHDKLLTVTQQLLAHSRRTLDALESDQILYGDKVRRLILALISSSAFILVFLYGTLNRLNREQRVAQARIAHQATHDSLTGLFNRAAVMEHIATRLRAPETEAALGGFAILLLDLDGFKAVNDSLGHDAGDRLLSEGGNRMKTVLRDSDYLARLGGDEFLVVVPQVSDQETARHVAQKLIDVLSGPFFIHVTADAPAQSATVTASIGISMYPQDAQDRETLMKHADLALYVAKHGGRNQLRFYEAGMQAGAHSAPG